MHAAYLWQDAMKAQAAWIDCPRRIEQKRHIESDSRWCPPSITVKTRALLEVEAPTANEYFAGYIVGERRTEEEHGPRGIFRSAQSSQRTVLFD